jgi:hypothetical protein
MVVIKDTSIYKKAVFDRAMHSTNTLTIQETHPTRLHVDEETLCRQDPITSVA